MNADLRELEMREEIGRFKGRALLALVRVALLFAAGAGLIAWGSWLGGAEDSKGAAYLLFGGGMWFLQRAWCEVPEWRRLCAEAERLRRQWGEED